MCTRERGKEQRESQIQASGQRVPEPGDTFRGTDEQFKGVWSVRRLRSSWWDLRDTGKRVMSLRSPESRMGTAEAQILTWEAGRKGLWPGTCSSVLLPSPTPP